MNQCPLKPFCEVDMYKFTLSFKFFNEALEQLENKPQTIDEGGFLLSGLNRFKSIDHTFLADSSFDIKKILHGHGV